MSELPPGWAWVDVQLLADATPAALTDGPFGSNLKTSHYTASGPRVIRLQNIGDGRFLDDKAHIAPEHFERLRRHEARAGEVVIAMLGNQLPRACVVPGGIGPAIVKADCARLRVDPEVALATYVCRGLNSETVRRQARQLVHGVGRPRLGLGLLKGLRFPLAPVAEQRRLLDVLESYLSRVDAAVATLERVQRNLKRYRASVLKAAVEGRLVPLEAELARVEHRDYEPASELLERILAERRQRWDESARRGNYEEPSDSTPLEPSKLPDGWVWARIGNVGQVQLGRQRAPEHHEGSSMRPYLRVANVFEDELRLDDVKEMNFDEAAYETYRLEPGDILLNEGQSPHLVGRAALYRGEVPGACFQNTLVRFKAAGGVDPKYALLVFRAQLHALRYLRIAKITTNIAHLGAERFAQVEFPLPPIREQERIVEAAESALTRINAAEAQVRAERTHLARLRQSILKWAFEGKLVDQDLNDEPASLLLERIRAERAASAPVAKSRGMKPRAKVTQ